MLLFLGSSLPTFPSIAVEEDWETVGKHNKVSGKSQVRWVMA